MTLTEARALARRLCREEDKGPGNRPRCEVIPSDRPEGQSDHARIYFIGSATGKHSVCVCSSEERVRIHWRGYVEAVRAQNQAATTEILQKLAQ